MPIPVAIRRQGFRIAHRLMRMWWFFSRPPHHGVKCLLTDGDRVLLVRHTYGDPAWDLPGGGLKRSESPHAAARREIEEELGVAIDRWQALGDLLRISYGCEDTLHCFQAEPKDPQITLNEAELSDARWFPEGQLPTDIGRHVAAIVRMAARFRPADTQRVTPA